MAFLRVGANCSSAPSKYVVFDGSFQNGHSRGADIVWQGYTNSGGFSDSMVMTTPTTNAYGKGSVISKQVNLSDYTKIKVAFRYSGTDFTYEGDISNLNVYANVIISAECYNDLLTIYITLNSSVSTNQYLNAILTKTYGAYTPGANLSIYEISFE